MKRYFLKTLLVMVSLSLLSTQCSEDDDDGNSSNNSVDIALIIDSVQDGTWIVSSLIDSGVDETNDFNGYNFTFASSGTLTASNGDVTKLGIWSVTDSDNDDNSSSNDDIDFNIFFNVPETDDFEDLNDDWDVISYSSTRIELRDVSGGDGSIDSLVFTKN